MIVNNSLYRYLPSWRNTSGAAAGGVGVLLSFYTTTLRTQEWVVRKLHVEFEKASFSFHPF